MTPFLFSLGIMYLSWWMLSAEFRKFLYTEWTSKPVTTWDHLRGAISHILKQLSGQNVQAQGFIDGELKLLDQRRSFMLFSFQRLAVIFPGLILLAVLQIEVFVGLIVAGTILLAIFFKKPSRWIQIAFLGGVFFMTYQWSFYQANKWIFAPETSELVYLMADARTMSILGFLTLGILLTWVTRYEYWSLWLGSILFFAGGLAYLNLFALILGESLGWSLYWFFLSRKSSIRNKKVHQEILLLTSVAAFCFIFALMWLKSLGVLDIRILSPIFSKKLSLVFGCGLWEVFLSCALMAWGHFRAKSSFYDTAKYETIQIPKRAFGFGFFNYRSWLPDQLEFRKVEIKRRIDSIESSAKQMRGAPPGTVPLALLQKSVVEVESLKQLLGALSKNSL